MQQQQQQEQMQRRQQQFDTQIKRKRSVEGFTRPPEGFKTMRCCVEVNVIDRILIIV